LEGDAVRAALTAGCYSDGAINTAWVGNPEVEHGPAVVSGFVCGVARTLLEDEAAAVAALDELVSTVAGRRVTRIAETVKDWTFDPYALAVTVTPGVDQLGDVVAVAAAPDRRIHFAGDYTEERVCGRMEGAVRSGE